MNKAEPDPEMEFVDVLRMVWQYRWLVVLISVSFAAMGTVYVLLATPQYRAQVTLIRKESQRTPGALAQLGGLASLAGISIGGEDGSASIAVLKSRGLARDFIQSRQLVPVLFAKEWDAGAKRWKSSDPQKQRDVQDAVNLFDREVRSVVEDKKAGIISVSITWSDRKAAADWANELVRMVNERMRQETLLEAERNVLYLRSELASSNMPSMQQALGRLLEAEMQKLLLAKGSEEFAFRIVDRAEIPKKPVSPRSVVTILGCFIIGLVLTFVGILLRRATSASGR